MFLNVIGVWNYIMFFYYLVFRRFVLVFFFEIRYMVRSVEEVKGIKFDLGSLKKK